MVDYKATMHVLQYIQAHPYVSFDAIMSGVSKLGEKNIHSSSLYAILRVLLQEGKVLKDKKKHEYRAGTTTRAILLQPAGDDPGIFDLHVNISTFKQFSARFDVYAGKVTHRCDEFVRKAKTNKLCDHLTGMITSDELKTVLAPIIYETLFKNFRTFLLDAQPELQAVPIDQARSMILAFQQKNKDNRLDIDEISRALGIDVLTTRDALHQLHDEKLV